jgi:hypothetical protein
MRRCEEARYLLDLIPTMRMRDSKDGAKTVFITIFFKTKKVIGGVVMGLGSLVGETTAGGACARPCLH